MAHPDRRRATRIRVDVPATVEVLGVTPEQSPDDPAYECVPFSTDMAGAKFAAAVLDISTGGARLAGETIPPVLSRLSVIFDLEGYGPVLAIAIVMWRRTAPGSMRRPGGPPVTVDPGFGVLFEAIDLEARKTIALLVARQAGG